MTQCLNTESRNGDGPAASLCSIRRFRWLCAQENAPRSGFNLWNALPCAHATSGCGIFSVYRPNASPVCRKSIRLRVRVLIVAHISRLNVRKCLFPLSRCVMPSSGMSIFLASSVCA